MSQLAGKITEMNLESTGQDLVITSQHMGSRPEHAPWQNKVFSYSGLNKKYPNFFLETGYGTVDGLKGVNCTHDFFPYWEGDYIPPDVEPNEEYYKNTQKQRAMERGIRATKREIEAQKAIGGSVTELKAKLKKQTAAYHAFSNKVGIRAKDNRLVVISGSSSIRNTNTYRKFISASRKNAIKGNEIITAQSKIRKIKENEIIKKGIALDIPVFDDEALGRAYRTRNIEDKGKYYDIVGHGSPDIIEFFGQNISAETVKKILIGRKDYQGQKIRLISCNTGVVDENGNCFAQRLANIMNTQVIAPDGLLNIHADGKITIGVNPYRNTGKMIEFKPEKKVRNESNNKF